MALKSTPTAILLQCKADRDRIQNPTKKRSKKINSDNKNNQPPQFEKPLLPKSKQKRVTIEMWSVSSLHDEEIFLKTVS
jgi:hypothetical protein